jgi:D-beta-D-heptose 7-phosphate kinase/D-beta-D-heptose 1-phosphate adenosyltransferase
MNGVVAEEVISNFRSRRVICVGDLMLDRFLSGTIERISPEGPVPVLTKKSTASFTGGAANVARNIAQLGGRCAVIGVVGEDTAAAELGELLCSEGIEARCVKDPQRPTTQKNRFISSGQQVLRVDEESVAPVSDRILQVVLDECRQRISESDVVVISDYAKEAVSAALVSESCKLARRRNIPINVDPKSGSFKKYLGATYITPNLKETHAAVGISVADDQMAESAGRAIREELPFEGVLITRESQGMSLIGRDGLVFHSRATAHEVFDVAGAEDTVVAAFALCLAAGADIRLAVTLANVAAGVVVGKRGTATLTTNELLAEASSNGAYEIESSRQKIRSLASAAKCAEVWRNANLRIGFTNGCFDIIHAGHVRSLQFARKL